MLGVLEPGQAVHSDELQQQRKFGWDDKEPHQAKQHPMESKRGHETMEEEPNHRTRGGQRKMSKSSVEDTGEQLRHL